MGSPSGTATIRRQSPSPRCTTTNARGTLRQRATQGKDTIHNTTGLDGPLRIPSRQEIPRGSRGTTDDDGELTTTTHQQRTVTTTTRDEGPQRTAEATAGGKG